MPMEDLTARLLGELIGVARATDGSEHLISPALTAELLRLLRIAAAGEASAEDCEAAVRAKRSIVPNCFSCANPCGRTFAFDLKELSKEDPELRQLKELLLQAAMDLAVRPALSPAQEPLLYTALTAVGLDGLDPAAARDLLTRMVM